MNSLRTCLVCRVSQEKKGLWRFVRSIDGEIRFDLRGSLPNRGAWTCAKKTCLVRAINKKLFFKDKKVLPVESHVMLSDIFLQLKKNVLSNLGLLRRQNFVEVGQKAVIQAISRPNTHVVLLAENLSQRSKDLVLRTSSAHSSVRTLICPLVMDEIGKSLGRRPTGVVALSQGRITNQILTLLDQLLELKH